MTHNTTNTHIIKESIKNKLQERLKLLQPSKYKQFNKTFSQGFISYQCPSCNEIFGLSAKHLEKIGESSYLHPYSCPYCTESYTIKD